MNRRVISKIQEKIFKILSFCCVLFALAMLLILLLDVFLEGHRRLSWSFFANFPSRKPELCGIFPALIGTIWIIVVTAFFALPLGIGAGIYLEEYSKKNWLTNLIEINIANLAATPSIIYGLLGLGIFVHFLKLGSSILVGGITLALLILPIVIFATKEALRAIPFSIREGSYALGATKWQTIRYQLLPAAFGSIMTGIILAMSRAIGETAPLIAIGAIVYITFLPPSPVTFVEGFPFIHFSLRGVLEPFTVLPLQIFNWVVRPQEEFFINAAAAIIVLLILTIIMNATAIILRYHYQKKIRW